MAELWTGPKTKGFTKVHLYSDMKEEEMKKGLRFGFVFLVFFLVHSALLVFAQQPLMQVVDKGEINWAEQSIRATGSGAPNPDAPNIAAARLGAERAAKADALRNILETVKGVRIDSETLVVNAMTQNDVIRTRVQGWFGEPGGQHALPFRWSGGSNRGNSYGQPGRPADSLAATLLPPKPWGPNPRISPRREPGVHGSDLRCPGPQYPACHVSQGLG